LLRAVPQRAQLPAPLVALLSAARPERLFGATVGAVAGGIADESRPRFRTYVTGQRHHSYRYENDLRVGADLPSSGVTYYEVPREYGVTKYRYTVVNDRTVLVDPGTHRIVEIID
jgi:hypothetical protein